MKYDRFLLAHQPVPMETVALWLVVRSTDSGTRYETARMCIHSTLFCLV